MKVHTSLPVHNIESTTAFYSILFNTKPSKTKTDYIKFEPSDLALNISFHQADQDKALNTSQHLGIQFASQDDLNIAYNRLDKAGLISQEKEASICCYANQDKFWVQDPDGYQWELYYLLEDSHIKIDENTSCCANTDSHAGDKTACC